METDWNNLFKIRLSNIVDISMDKHDIVKLLIVRKLLRKYTKRKWIRIYTEFKLNGLTPDIYFENLKTKEVICYEIQKSVTKEWLQNKTKQYDDYEINNFKLDWVLVPLKELSNDIRLINKELDEFVV